MTTTEAFEALMPEPDHSLDNGTLHFYTAEQMRAMFDAATERAAKLCEELADDLSKQWRAGHKTNSHIEGQSDGAFDCAAAIRARDEGVRG